MPKEWNADTTFARKPQRKITLREENDTAAAGSSHMCMYARTDAPPVKEEMSRLPGPGRGKPRPGH